MLQPSPEVMLGAGLALGPSEGIVFGEQAAGDMLRSQDPTEWIQLPAQMDTTGVYGNLGYNEATEARDIGWLKQREPIFSTTCYWINVATFLEAGFQFVRQDLRNYVAARQFQDLAYKLFGDTVYSDDPDPVRLKRSKSRWKAQRWCRDFYLGSQRDTVFIRGRMPPGWTMEDEHHHYGYWTRMVDADGNERGTIFHKAYEHCYMRLKEPNA